MINKIQNSDLSEDIIGGAYDSLTNWKHVQRFQDTTFAEDCVLPSIKYIEENYPKNEPLLIFGFCSGNGIVEYELATILYNIGYKNIAIVSSDLEIREQTYVKQFIFPVKEIILDVKQLPTDRNTISNYHKSAQRNPNLLVISRAWHHYFNNENEKSVRKNIYSLLKPNELFIDLPSSGTEKYLKIMEDFHSLFGKTYKHHSIKSYIKLTEEIDTKYSGNLSLNGINSRKSRTFSDAFINRYNEIYKEFNHVESEGIKLIEHMRDKMVSIIINSSYPTKEIQYSDDLKKIVTETEDPDKVEIIDQEIISNDEVILIKDKSGKIIDFILTYSYPVFIFKK